MKDELNTAYLRQIRTVMVLAVIVLALFVLKATSEVTLPVAFALFLFAFVNPIMERLTKFRVPSGVAILLVMVLVVSLFLVVAYFLGIMVNMLIAKLPYYAERVKSVDALLSAYAVEYIDDIPANFSLIGSLNVDWYSILMSWLTSISSRVLSLLSDVMIILITLMFLLLERSTFMPKVSVALDDGSIYAYNAVNYNSQPAQVSWNTDEDTARQQLPENVSCEGSRKVILRSAGEQDLPCYEFSCLDDQDRSLRIYVNADTGKQCRIDI